MATLKTSKLLSISGWTLALLFALSAPLVVLNGHTSKRTQDFRRNPVRTTAHVTQAYIDGFGGDPTIDYQFSVNGRTYYGSGTGGQLGNGDVLRLSPGSSVAIEYSALDPTLSCTCSVQSGDDWRLPWDGSRNWWGTVLVLPLLALGAYILRRKLFRKYAGSRSKTR